ncbi:Polycomb protein Sfmbt [Amphibalanus amphitrite]|uniref:Polycomb protein Sfmbt n=1 Tax=Amphibalanus amphitrite TaxID=1232801 RepID=A0A6A4X100_AMPAM|nr:Polycomb protein Sfmbt [Amphibalanus amphitrite]
MMTYVADFREGGSSKDPPPNGSGDAGGDKDGPEKEAPKPAEPKPPAPPVKKIKHCSSRPYQRNPRSPPPPPAANSAFTAQELASSFCWDHLMRKATFEAAPVECFRHAPLSQTWRNVCAGLKAEVAQKGVGKGAPTTYWVATLLQVQGYRGLFRPEGLGSDSSLDRWLEICSPEVKPVGWCASRGLPLTPPPPAGPAADWQRRLVGVLTGSRTLPPSFYRKVMSSLSRGSQLSVGQTIEVVDKSCISQMRAARITRQIGRRLHVHYLDAHPDDGGFWCHENSPLVHPVGWSRAVGHRIQAPDDYLARCESGRFLPTDATEDYLPAPPAVTHEGFKLGMKLEALDPLNLGSIGVATVRDTLQNHFIMVQLETEPESDWFCYHASSPYIFPPGFCRTVGIPLTPPHSYRYMEGQGFFWEVYLRAEGASAAPAHLFHRPPLSHGFQPGHKLEAVDLMDPQLVCAATVGQVVGRLLRIHFDGWEEQFDQWADVESPDLFPVGWCKLVGYPLEPPRPPDKILKKPGPKKRRGRPRGPRGAGGRTPRTPGRRSAGGEDLSESHEAESELESTVGDGESMAESAAGRDDSTVRSLPGETPEPELRLEFTPTPTSGRRSEGSVEPTPEPGGGPAPPTQPAQPPVPAAGADTVPEPAAEPRTEAAEGRSEEATEPPRGPQPQTEAEVPQAEAQPMEVCEQGLPEAGDVPPSQGPQGDAQSSEGSQDPSVSTEQPMET